MVECKNSQKGSFSKVLTFDHIQSSCENKGSEEMEPQPLPNHPGVPNTTIIQKSTFAIFCKDCFSIGNIKRILFVSRTWITYQADWYEFRLATIVKGGLKSQLNLLISKPGHINWLKSNHVESNWRLSYTARYLCWFGLPLLLFLYATLNPISTPAPHIYGVWLSQCLFHCHPRLICSLEVLDAWLNGFAFPCHGTQEGKDEHWDCL